MEDTEKIVEDTEDRPEDKTANDGATEQMHLMLDKMKKILEIKLDMEESNVEGETSPTQEDIPGPAPAPSLKM